MTPGLKFMIGLALLSFALAMCSYSGDKPSARQEFIKACVAGRMARPRSAESDRFYSGYDVGRECQQAWEGTQ